MSPKGRGSHSGGGYLQARQSRGRNIWLHVLLMVDLTKGSVDMTYLVKMCSFLKLYNVHIQSPSLLCGGSIQSVDIGTFTL